MNLKDMLHKNNAEGKSLKSMLTAQNYEDTDASRKVKREASGGRKKDCQRSHYAMGGVAKERLGYPDTQ